VAVGGVYGIQANITAGSNGASATTVFTIPGCEPKEKCAK
jgi:hypothetical protein